MKKMLLLCLLGLGVQAFAAKNDVNKTVLTKYANPNTGATDQWGALNCHDPKIFQDDEQKAMLWHIVSNLLHQQLEY